MKIVRVDGQAIVEGHVAFQAYMAAMVCGPGSADYKQAMSRMTGAKILVGVILSCIDNGLDSEAQIIDAASRITRCRSDTVRSMLTALTGSDPSWCFWQVDEWGYERLSDPDSEPAYPRLLIAA